MLNVFSGYILLLSQFRFSCFFSFVFSQFTVLYSCFPSLHSYVSHFPVYILRLFKFTFLFSQFTFLCFSVNIPVFPVYILMFLSLLSCFPSLDSYVSQFTFLFSTDEEPQKPTFEKQPLKWEEDAQLYSHFLDRKVGKIYQEIQL